MTARHDDPQLQALLASLRQDPPDDGFAARLHLQLAAAGQPATPGAWARGREWLRERPWLVGAMTGTAAGVGAFALSAALMGRPAAPVAKPASSASSQPALAAACPAQDSTTASAAGVATSAEVFVVPAGKVAMVQLSFTVERDVDEAEFSVLLPEGLSFFSEGQALPERSVHWVAPLAAGDNRVPIAVISAVPGRHRLAATATIAGEVVVHEIVLDVKEPA